MKPGGEHRLYGTVISVIADNLGAHAIGGFLESFNCLNSKKRKITTELKDDMPKAKNVQLFADEARFERFGIHKIAQNLAKAGVQKG